MAGLSPEARALLETIAGPESKGDYNVLYGGKQFDSYADHPRVAVPITRGPNKGKTSSAAGKYQFLGSTWDEIAGDLGLSDFSPASQDAAAYELARQEYRRDTGRDLGADLAAGKIGDVPGSLRNQWTSLPGGIEQGITMGGFESAYAKALAAANPGVGNSALAAIGGAVGGKPAAPGMGYAPVPGAPGAGVRRATAMPGMGYAPVPGAPGAGVRGAPAAPTAPGGGLGSLFGGALSGLAGIADNVKGAASNAADMTKQILTSTVAGRTGIAKALMGMNIGKSPTITQGFNPNGTPAIGVNSRGSSGVTMSSASPGRSAYDASVHAGQDMGVYRANAAVLGAGNMNQSSINQALANGKTLYKPANGISMGRRRDDGVAQSIAG